MRQGFGLMLIIIISITLGGVKGASAASIAIWWPVEGAVLANTQPFKALVDGMSVNDYSMYWQVDGGQLNGMADNYNDYPHKEASVSLNNWNWQTNGVYRVTFIAKDRQGSTIGEKTVSIRTENTLASSLPPERKIETGAVSVWWPANNASLSGTQPFKALVDNADVNQYKMYWSVDGGQENTMETSYADHPHKEASVDVTNWSWKGSEPYQVSFIAKNSDNQEIGRRTSNIRIETQSKNETPQNPEPSSAPSTDLQNTTTTPDPITSPVPVVPPLPVGRESNPLSGLAFYVNPDSNAFKQEKAWKNARPGDAQEMEKIAREPEARWFGNWNSNVRDDIKKYVNDAAKADKVPVMIVYNIPERDCGQYSAGGSSNATLYTNWIDKVADGIGNHKAVVIVEPDSLSLIDCLSESGKAERFALVRQAVEILKTKTMAIVYIDAGHSSWISKEDMAKRLKLAGIEKADGFALNVSNYYPTSDLINYGKGLSSLLDNKHFVIDTSRNGNGSNGEWCNPGGRALGVSPTTDTGNDLVDAFLWLKNPGESDGTCNGGPSAGVWWPEYALGLAERSVADTTW